MIKQKHFYCSPFDLLGTIINHCIPLTTKRIPIVLLVFYLVHTSSEAMQRFRQLDNQVKQLCLLHFNEITSQNFEKAKWQF